MFLGRVVTPGEPLWIDEDRAYALALLSYEADQCSGCGGRRSQTTDPAMDGHFKATPIRCFGCEAVAKASKNPDLNPDGLYYAVSPIKDWRRPGD